MTKEQAIRHLKAAAEKLSKATAARDEAMRRRDEALRAAQGAGASYVEMQEASGLSAVTVSKALRRQ